jgi:hypothetical protein
VRKLAKDDNNKFNRLDWAIVLVIGALLLAGVLFGAFKLMELEQCALDSQAESSLENDSEVRGSQILDIFVSGNSALILVIDDCDDDSDCSEYLAELFIGLLDIKKSAPPVVVFDTVAANNRGDTNLAVALQKLNVVEFPTLVLIENGEEVARKAGIDNANDELYYWLVENGIIADEENFGD